MIRNILRRLPVTSALAAWTFVLVCGLASMAPSCGIKCPPGMEGTPGSCHCLPGYVPVDPSDPTNLKGCVPGPSPTPTSPPEPSPTPSATPTPTPSPTTAPTASPVPTAPPTSAACNAMPECGGLEGPPGVWGCCSEHRPSRYHAEVEATVESVKTFPGMMHEDGRVVDEDRFMAAVIDVLRMHGYCATRGGPEDEVGVKLGNDWSEQFDLLVGKTVPRVPASYHTVSCIPARF